MLAGWLCVGVGAALMPGVSGLCGCRDRVDVVVGLMSGPNNGVESEFCRRNRVLSSEPSSGVGIESHAETELVRACFGASCKTGLYLLAGIGTSDFTYKSMECFTINYFTLAQSYSPST